MPTERVSHTRRFLIPGPTENPSTKLEFTLTFIITFFKEDLWEFLTSNSPATMFFYILLVPLTLWTWAPQLRWALRNGLFFNCKTDHHLYEDWGNPYDSEDEPNAPWEVRFKRGLFRALLGPDHRVKMETENKTVKSIKTSKQRNAKNGVCSSRSEYLYSEEIINKAAMFFRNEKHESISNIKRLDSSNVSKTDKYEGKNLQAVCSFDNHGVYNDGVFNWFEAMRKDKLSREFAEKLAFNKDDSSNTNSNNTITHQKHNNNVVRKRESSVSCSDKVERSLTTDRGYEEVKDVAVKKDIDELSEEMSDENKACYLLLALTELQSWNSQGAIDSTAAEKETASSSFRSIQDVISHIRNLFTSSQPCGHSQEPIAEALVEESANEPTGLFLGAFKTLFYGSYAGEDRFSNANTKYAQQRNMRASSKCIMAKDSKVIRVHPKPAQIKHFVCLGKNDIGTVKVLKHQYEFKIVKLANVHQPEIKALQENRQIPLKKQQIQIPFIKGGMECDAEVAQLREVHRMVIDKLKKENMATLNAQEEFYSEIKRECIQERDELMQKHTAEIDELKEQHVAKFNAQEEFYSGITRACIQEREELVEEHRTELEELQKVHDQEFLAQEEYYKGSLTESEIYENAINRVASNIDSAREAEIKALRIAYDAKYIAQGKSFEAKAKQLGEEKTGMTKAHKVEITALHSMYGAKLKAQEERFLKATKQPSIKNVDKEVVAIDKNPEKAKPIQSHEAQIKELIAMYEARIADDRNGYEENMMKVMKWHDEEMESLRTALSKKGIEKEKVGKAASLPLSDMFNFDVEEDNKDGRGRINQPALGKVEKSKEKFKRSGDDWDGETDSDSELEGTGHKPASCLRTRSKGSPRRVAFRDPISEERVFTCDKLDSASGYESEIEYDSGSDSDSESEMEYTLPREAEDSGRTSRLSFNDSDEDSYASDEWDSGSDGDSEIGDQAPIKCVGSRRIKKPRVTIPNTDSEASDTSSCDECDLGSDCESDVPVEPPLKPAFKTRPKELEFDESDSEESDCEKIAIKQKQAISELNEDKEDRDDLSEADLFTESERESAKKTNELILECKKLKDPWAPENMPKFSDKFTAQQKEWLTLFVVHEIVTVPTVHPGRYIQIRSEYATRQDEEAFATLFKN
ncbi:hypothetical protein EV426DRAFT_717875 [Tirmania nivea]|nr:hypothetical protein EV426DRAFT_717875 [Tirmania nivea]